MESTPKIHYRESPLKSKRIRNVLSLSVKAKIIELVEKDKKSFAEVAKMYGKNESSIREILKNKDKIRSSFNIAPNTAKVSLKIRDGILVRVESELIKWIEEITKQKIPFDDAALRKKALSLYKEMSDKETSENSIEKEKPFTASMGWLFRFKNRFKLIKVKNTDESAFADEDAAISYSIEFKKIINEGKYHLKQVFNCDITGLYWKAMPANPNNEKPDPAFKASKDRLTLVLCCNAAGHMIKPGVIYNSKTPRSLKDKDKEHLPVFWQHNPKLWLTPTLFTEWFHQCFIPEVKKYLQQEDLPFKVLLVLSTRSSFSQASGTECENVQIVFLPPITTPLLQPLDQGIIRCVKASYKRLLFEMVQMSSQTDSTNILNCWRLFTIADSIMFIKRTIDELKPEIVNSCWRNLWSEAVTNFQEFPLIDCEINMLEEKLAEDIEKQQVLLSNQKLEEYIKSSTEDEDEDEQEMDVKPAIWTLENLNEVFSIAETLKEKIIEYDPVTERSIKTTKLITEAMEPLNKILKELKK